MERKALDEYIAEEIIQQIIHGDIDDKFPSMRDLSKSLKVSVTTVSIALRSLERSGLVIWDGNARWLSSPYGPEVVEETSSEQELKQEGVFFDSRMSGLDKISTAGWESASRVESEYQGTSDEECRLARAREDIQALLAPQAVSDLIKPNYPGN
jgi:DNA-binding transcriptional MocR family regulator